MNTDPERTRKVIESLLEWYQTPDGVLSETELPESDPPKGVQRGSYEHIMFLTLTVAIDYQRSARDLWNSSRKTWEDEKSRWVFSPKEVASRNMAELVETLTKYNLSKKPQKDANIWRTVALSFLDLFDGDPRKLFEKFNHDAMQIFTAMKAQYGKKFPYLAGSTGTGKIRSLWIRMLHDEAKIEFKNLQHIPLPIDIHTARATITTGCLFGKFEGSFSKLVDKAKTAWIEACSGTNHYPLELDEPLWNLSRLGCSKYRIGSPCPVRTDCRLSKFCTVNDPKSKMILKQNDLTIIDTWHPQP